MAQAQAQNGPVQGQVGWKGDFNAMAQKTVLRRLLSKYGFLSIEMMNALAEDEQPQFDAEAVRDEENSEPRTVINAEAVIHPVEEQGQTQEPEDQPHQNDRADHGPRRSRSGAEHQKFEKQQRKEEQHDQPHQGCLLEVLLE